ncbi:MAG: hypothetical protein QMC36_02380 [Patescibacteria group bacterium]
MRSTFLTRSPFLRFLAVRPRLVTAFLVAIAFDALLPRWVAIHETTRFILAWDV